MDPRILSTIGLILGIIGVLTLFFCGPPQPTLTPGVSLELENGTTIDDSGKTVADFNREIEERRKTCTIISRIGLFLIMIGFALQIWAVWSPAKPIEKVAENAPTHVSTDYEAAKQKTSQDSVEENVLKEIKNA